MEIARSRLTIVVLWRSRELGGPSQPYWRRFKCAEHAARHCPADHVVKSTHEQFADLVPSAAARSAGRPGSVAIAVRAAIRGDALYDVRVTFSSRAAATNAVAS
jgi:hypothetical protein